MSKHDQKQIEYSKEREEYTPQDVNKKDPMFKKLKHARMYLFFTPLVHIGTCIVFLILLLIGVIFKDTLGFTLTSLESALAFSYVGLAILIDALAFALPAKKANKKSWFRIIGIATLILSTLILSGSFVFWGTPTLLFYSVVTLIVWVFEVIAAIYFLLVVESLPN